MLAPSSLLLTVLFLAIANLFRLSHSAPNPNPSTRLRHDRAITTADQFQLSIYRTIGTLIWIHHALLTLTFPSTPTLLCPHPSNLNPKLFTWTPHTVACCLALFVGTMLRLRAYKDLGRNFTFSLAQPSKLVTTGIYRYVRHPSYTGMIVAAGGVTGLLTRSDSGIGCFAPEKMIEGMKWDGVVRMVMVVVGSFEVRKLWMRMRDEEGMMKEVFGREWEVWAGKTWKVVPGVL